jgi:hypothetical protein
MIETPSNIARAFRFRQRRAVAEGVARIKRLAVADGVMHVPAEIGGRAIEPVVDQACDFCAAFERAVEHVVIDAVLCEQFREGLAVALLDSVAEGAKHGCGVHEVASR